MDIITYKASLTGTKLHKSKKFVRAIVGPVGSGKSVTCINELLIKAISQEAYKGVRRSRWVIIRNTYRELIDTTIKTFFDWIPEESGVYIKQDMQFEFRARLQDGTLVIAEFLFRALDRPNDVKKLLSLELTGGFINECKEVPRAVFEMLQTRVGRYPRKKLGGPTWHGVICDTNPPDTDSWFYRVFEEDKPDNHEIFHQPSGTSSKAENIENLPEGYYQNFINGKPQEWVKVYVHGEYGFVSDGKPVYPEYKDHVHAIETFAPDPKRTLYIGLDFGLTPAALFLQVTPSGRVVCFDELVTFDLGAVEFSEELKKMLTTTYRNFKDIELWGDPSGDIRSQADKNTPFLVFKNKNMSVIPTYTNDPIVRREATAVLMSKLDMNGDPAFAVTTGAPTFRKALGGGYKYRRVQIVGDERFQDKPDKNKYSHVAEAGQYAVLGAVGGDAVIGGYDDKELDYQRINRAIV